jgi:murein tripeptide amidase MpaA
MKIDADFDGGSIVVLGDTDALPVALALRGDNAADFHQWFCFRTVGEADAPRAFQIENAHAAEYPGAWKGYRVCASYDGEDWFRVATRYEDGALTFWHTPSRRAVTYACFAPYSYARHRRVVGRAARSKRARVEMLGETVQGRPIPAITFGRAGPSSLRVWILARQHPGETMAAWCAEGIVERMLDESDVVAAALLEDAVLTIVPAMNLDGGVLGNHRTNAAGRDLNRAWNAPDPIATPEVFLARRAILESGVDLFLDIHGDETEPFVFAAGCEGNPSYSERIAALEAQLTASLAEQSPTFSLERGYEADAPGEADLSCAANWVGERFDCLSLTLELPFKDHTSRPNRRRGWSPGRSDSFGRTLLESVLVTLPDLR